MSQHDSKTPSIDSSFTNYSRTEEEALLPKLLEIVRQRALTPAEAETLTRLIDERSLAAWPEFMARTAHLLGTRVTVINGAITMLRSHLERAEVVKVDHREETHVLIQQVVEGVRMAQRALDELRRFATPWQPRYDRLDLVETLRAAVQATQCIVDCPIELNLPSAPLNLQGDKQKLTDAIIELISNSQEAMRQYTGRAPQVTIAANVETSSAGTGSVARIEFTDTGPGIPEEARKRLFEPFFSTKGRGSGLGLVIVKEIIQQHGGTIEEAGVFGMGARFIIYLPVTK